MLGFLTKFDRMQTTDEEQALPLCREYWSSRCYPKTKALSAIPEGTIIGPISEVHVVKIRGGNGIEVAIPSVANTMDTSYVFDIQRRKAFCE